MTTVTEGTAGANTISKILRQERYRDRIVGKWLFVGED